MITTLVTLIISIANDFAVSEYLLDWIMKCWRLKDKICDFRRENEQTIHYY